MLMLWHDKYLGYYMHYEERDFFLAEKFCSIVLGTDLFYRNRQEIDGEASFSKEGLVPVDFSGVNPIKISSWEEAIIMLSEIYENYETIIDTTRRNYMLQQIGSFRKICRWLSGVPMSFREIVAETMFVNENPIGKQELAREIFKLSKSLESAGYSGNTEKMLAAWRKNREITNIDEVYQVLQELLANAKTKTLELGLSAIEDFDVTASLVFNVPYNAYCDYYTRTIQINGDVIYTYEELKHLVAHEAYPGHMTHMAHRQKLLEAGKIPADAGLVITNTASSPIFEGIADYGLTLLNWLGSDDDKVCYYLNRVQSMCNLNAAYMMHSMGVSDDNIKDYMRKHFFNSKSKIESRMRFISYPLRKPFMYAYWRGWEGIERGYAQIEQTQLSNYYKYIYDHMHSIDTALQFNKN